MLRLTFNEQDKTICVIYFGHDTHIAPAYALESTREFKFVY